MSDESKTAETIAPTEASSAPAVHTGELWGGPRWIENASKERVFVETKEQYFALLNTRGLRMKDQQESTTGPEHEKVIEVPLSLQPTTPPDPLTQDEAHLIAATFPVRQRYGFKEALYCNRCYTRKRWHGCRVIVTSRRVIIKCGCGEASYVAPTGTTDLLMDKIASTPVREQAMTSAVVQVNGASKARPAALLSAMEAKILRAYDKLLGSRGYFCRWFHPACVGATLKEDDACSMDISAYQIVIACRCRVVFEQSGTPPPPTVIH